jgi:hypothetical protein
MVNKQNPFSNESLARNFPSVRVIQTKLWPRSSDEQKLRFVCLLAAHIEMVLPGEMEELMGVQLLDK